MRSAITLLLLLLVCACAQQPVPPGTDSLPKAVKSIAVLPVGVMSESGAPPASPQTGKAMAEGVAVLDQILAEAFAANPKVRLLSDEEVSVHSQSYGVGPVAQALEIGKAMGAEAVMLWGLVRYNERTGGDYGVQTPSSVAFQYRLVHAESGQTLCSASFDETQQSAAANLLAFNSFAKRGFKWVPAAVLLREGVIKKIAECKYLKVATGQEGEAGPVVGKEPDDVWSSATEPLAPKESSTPPPPQEIPPPVALPAPQQEVVAPVPASVPDVQSKEISQLLEEWRKAWQATAGPQGDIDHYGAFYAADFRNGKQDRNRWLADKLRKNHGKEWIRLMLFAVTITQVEEGPLWEAHFVQEYTSSNYSETSPKTLVLRKNGNNWEIVAER